jgi:hypothetical protein
MPGKPVNDQQARTDMTDRLHFGKRGAAARTGFSERTARRLERVGHGAATGSIALRWRARIGVEAVWEPVLLPILERDPAVEAVTLLRHFQMTDPEAVPDERARRTLERRVRDWHGLHGPGREPGTCQRP